MTTKIERGVYAMRRAELVTVKADLKKAGISTVTIDEAIKTLGTEL